MAEDAAVRANRLRLLLDVRDTLGRLGRLLADPALDGPSVRASGAWSFMFARVLCGSRPAPLPWRRAYRARRARVCHANCDECVTPVRHDGRAGVRPGRLRSRA